MPHSPKICSVHPQELTVSQSPGEVIREVAPETGASCPHLSFQTGGNTQTALTGGNPEPSLILPAGHVDYLLPRGGVERDMGPLWPNQLLYHLRCATLPQTREHRQEKTRGWHSVDGTVGEAIIPG